jgi:hypothetical protein
MTGPGVWSTTFRLSLATESTCRLPERRELRLVLYTPVLTGPAFPPRRTGFFPGPEFLY